MCESRTQSHRMLSNTEIDATTRKRLTADINKHMDDQRGDWDRQVESEDAPLGLWDGIPNIDSKEVARMRPIFEKHLGLPFDINHIPPGGYMSVDELIDDLVPKLTGVPLPAGPANTANGEQNGD